MQIESYFINKTEKKIRTFSKNKPYFIEAWWNVHK